MTNTSLSRRKLAIACATFVAFSACNRPTPVEIPITPEPLDPVPVFRIDDLDAANQRDFEKAFPSSVREVFDNAAEIRISSGKAGEEITVEEPSEKKMVLDALYWDLANSYPRDLPGTGFACKETGPIISTTARDENLMEWKYTIRPSYFLWLVRRSCKRKELFNDISQQEFHLKQAHLGTN